MRNGCSQHAECAHFGGVDDYGTLLLELEGDLLALDDLFRQRAVDLAQLTRFGHDSVIELVDEQSKRLAEYDDLEDHPEMDAVLRHEIARDKVDELRAVKNRPENRRD